MWRVLSLLDQRQMPRGTRGGLGRLDHGGGRASLPVGGRQSRWTSGIEFAGWTATGMIRQASFKGLRRDKPASEVVAELPSPVESAHDEPDEKLAAHVKDAAKSRAATKRAAARPSGASSNLKSGVAIVMGVTLSKPAKALWRMPGMANRSPSSTWRSTTRRWEAGSCRT
jgi:hypothetical protein